MPAGESLARAIGKQGLSKLPGSLEALWWVNDLARDKWHRSPWKYLSGNPLPKLMREWRNDLTSIPLLSHLARKKVLFVAGGLSNIIEHSLATSFVLAHRNCEVDVALFDDVRAERSNDKYSRRKFRYYYGGAINGGPDHSPRHKLIHLAQVPESGLTEDVIAEARAQALVDIVYITRRETIDPDGRDRELYHYRIKRNCDLMARLGTLMKQKVYDLLITPNGAVLEYGAAYRLSCRSGLPAGTYEFWDGPGKAAASFGPNVLSLNTEELWKNDEPHELTSARHQRAVATLNARLKSQPGGLDRRQLMELLPLRPNAPVVLICPNVPFDGMFLGTASLFCNMREWLVETTRDLRSNRSQPNIIVRSHPREADYDPEETASSIIRDMGDEIQQLVHVIPAESTISTYDLMRIADLGVVYSSTTGLEMATQGVPVVCGNHFHYNGKGFTHDSLTKDQYFETIEKILSSPSRYRLSPRQVELALSYLDIYFNDFPHAFPWTFADFWRSLEEWPVRRVISPEGDAAFGSFFDQILGVKVESGYAQSLRRGSSERNLATEAEPAV
jgi:hypothetical protein